jgi:hypothetical protein
VQGRAAEISASNVFGPAWRSHAATSGRQPALSIPTSDNAPPPNVRAKLLDVDARQSVESYAFTNPAKGTGEIWGALCLDGWMIDDLADTLVHEAIHMCSRGGGDTVITDLPGDCSADAIAGQCQ